VDPNNKVLDTLDGWITGLRADQSNARSQIKQIEIIQHTQQDGKERPILKVTPLIEWTEERVKDYIRTHKVPVHKLLEIERDGWHYASLGCIIEKYIPQIRPASLSRGFQNLNPLEREVCFLIFVPKRESLKNRNRYLSTFSEGQ
jgi:hypothetical protein